MWARSLCVCTRSAPRTSYDTSRGPDDCRPLGTCPLPPSPLSDPTCASSVDRPSELDDSRPLVTCPLPPLSKSDPCFGSVIKSRTDPLLSHAPSWIGFPSLTEGTLRPVHRRHARVPIPAGSLPPWPSPAPQDWSAPQTPPRSMLTATFLAALEVFPALVSSEALSAELPGPSA